MKRVVIEVPDGATNFDVYEKVFGFVDESSDMTCRFVEDLSIGIRHNYLSKAWGNSPFRMKGE